MPHKPRPRSTDPRVDRSRAAALQASGDILLDEGWEAVTHLRVAEQAGLGRATIYRHWPTTADLLRDTLASQAAVVHATATTGDLATDLVAELDAVLVQLDRGLGRVIATLIDRAEWDDDLHGIKTSLVVQETGPIRQLLRQAKRAGALVPSTKVDLVVAELLGLLLYRRLISAEPVTRRTVRAIVADVLRSHGT